jgi:hypothetical protein
MPSFSSNRIPPNTSGGQFQPGARPLITPAQPVAWTPSSDLRRGLIVLGAVAVGCLGILSMLPHPVSTATNARETIQAEPHQSLAQVDSGSEPTPADRASAAIHPIVRQEARSNTENSSATRDQTSDFRVETSPSNTLRPQPNRVFPSENYSQPTQRSFFASQQPVTVRQQPFILPPPNVPPPCPYCGRPAWQHIRRGNRLMCPPPPVPVRIYRAPPRIPPPCWGRPIMRPMPRPPIRICPRSRFPR